MNSREMIHWERSICGSSLLLPSLFSFSIIPFFSSHCSFSHKPSVTISSLKDMNIPSVSRIEIEKRNSLKLLFDRGNGKDSGYQNQTKKRETGMKMCVDGCDAEHCD